jgi:hypothetical protein
MAAGKTKGTRGEKNATRRAARSARDKPITSGYLMMTMMIMYSARENRNTKLLRIFFVLGTRS